VAIALVMLLVAGCKSGAQSPTALEPERGEGETVREQVYTPPPVAEPSVAAADTSTEPSDAEFPIEELETRYTKDIQGDGPLFAVLVTSKGTIHCELFEALAPRTVDNFVGLARGLKNWRDPATRKTVQRPFYDGLTFHRVVSDVLIQSGDPTGSGMGDPGYFILDEFAEGLAHDTPGTLSMVQSRPNGNGSQFFITVAAAPQFDGRYPIFGRCEDLDVITAISQVDTGDSRVQKPREPVVLEAVTFERR